MLINENTQILHCLSILLIKASLIKLNLSIIRILKEPKKNLLPLHQVFVYGTHVLPQLCVF